MQRSRKILARMEFVQFREEGTTILSVSPLARSTTAVLRSKTWQIVYTRASDHRRRFALRFASSFPFPSLPSRSPSISYLSFALLSEAAVYRAKGRGRRTRGSAEEASEGRAKIRQSYSPRYDTNNKNHKHSDPLIKSFREDVPKPPFPRDEDRIVASTGHLFPPSFRVILSGHERCGYMGTRLSFSRSRAAAARARASPCERPSRLYVVVASIARL